MFLQTREEIQIDRSFEIAVMKTNEMYFYFFIYNEKMLKIHS